MGCIAWYRRSDGTPQSLEDHIEGSSQLGVSIPEGALFCGQEQHREVVPLDEALRRETEETAAAVHRMLVHGRTPAPEYAKRCESCSLVETCRPKELGAAKRGRVARYLARALAEVSG